MNTYRRFSDSGISLAPIGIAARDDNVPYFCTPKGTSIIGGADRPTAIVFGASSKGKISTVCPAVHFEPVQKDVDWCITFHEKRYEDFGITLI